MRVINFALLAAVAVSGNGLAQVPSIVEGAPFEARQGQWKKVISNQSPSSLVAFFVTPPHCSYANPGPGVTYDALVYSGNREIPSGESTEIQAGDPSKCPGSVNAAIFSDEHVEGDPKALDRLYSARQGAYKALNESIELLNSIRDQPETTQHAIDALDSKRQARLQQRTETALGYNGRFRHLISATRCPRASSTPLRHGARESCRDPRCDEEYWFAARGSSLRRVR